jgi:hypothetical protein
LLFQLLTASSQTLGAKLRDELAAFASAPEAPAASPTLSSKVGWEEIEKLLRSLQRPDGAHTAGWEVDETTLFMVKMNRRSYFVICQGVATSDAAAFAHSFTLRLTDAPAQLYIESQCICR